MKAIILAAGYGTRLHPITKDKPKPLLPIANKPLLNYIVEKIDPINEIDEAIIVTNDKFHTHFMEWLTTHKTKFETNLSLISDGSKSNEERLGAVNDLWLAVKNRGIKDDIMVLTGDSLFDFSINKVVDYFNEKKKMVNVIYRLGNKENAKRFGVVELEGNRIANFQEKPKNPPTDIVSIGIYVFPKEQLKKIEEYINTDKPKEEPGNLLQHFQQQDEVYGFLAKGEYFDIGVPEDYKQADKVWRSK